VATTPEILVTARRGVDIGRCESPSTDAHESATA
jgi:hypothetical protein